MVVGVRRDRQEAIATRWWRLRRSGCFPRLLLRFMEEFEGGGAAAMRAPRSSCSAGASRACTAAPV